jgi:protein gp37
VKGHPFEQGFDLKLIPEKLAEPLRWKSARRIFVNSMSDLFHPDVPDDYIEQVCRVMVAANWHTYQVLTKRSERMAQLLKTKLKFATEQTHIWWGVSVEDRQYGVSRIAHLQSAPAAVRFLSIEPLLEDIGAVDLSGITWVIVGGESGPGARPMQREWVVSLRNQCRKARVRFFFKQWGGVRKHTTGRELDGKTYNDAPKYRGNPIPIDSKRLELIRRAEARATDFVSVGELAGD